MRIALLLLTFGATVARAQVLPELRADVFGPPPVSVQPGAGVSTAIGYYVRAAVDVGYAPKADARFIADRWRADLITRFLFDPFREQRWALSVGGGLSVHRHAYLAVVMDLETPPVRGFIPAFEIGLSGGVRGGLVVRRAREGRR